MRGLLLKSWRSSSLILKMLSRAKGRIFILPTKYGLYFFLILFVLFLISLSYGHSLAFVSTFIFVSILMASAHITNYNLAKIEILSIKCPPDFFEGTDQEIKILLKNHSSSTKFDIELNIGRFETLSVVSIAPHSYQEIYIPLKGLKRGAYESKRICLSTTFPFGLFRSWNYHFYLSSFLVYPRPEGKKEMFKTDTSSHLDDQGNLSFERGSTDFDGHSKYEFGQAWSRIDWRVYAREKGLYVKDYNEITNTRVLLKEVEKNDKAASQLCAWIERAFSYDIEYAVEWGGYYLDFGRGIRQRKKSLEMISTCYLEKKIISLEDL